jgi:hypothetical protein
MMGCGGFILTRILTGEVVEMRVWCIKFGIVIVLHSKIEILILENPLHLGRRTLRVAIESYHWSYNR